MAKYSAPRYGFMTRDREGRAFHMKLEGGTAAFGMCRTLEEAHAVWLSKPRVGTAFIFEERDAIAHGVAYGLTNKIVATAGVL